MLWQGGHCPPYYSSAVGWGFFHNLSVPKPAEPEPNKIAGSQAPLGNSQAGSSSFPFVFVARARTYRAGREAELLVLGFPSRAWETAKSLHDLSKVNCLETNWDSSRHPSLRCCSPTRKPNTPPAWLEFAIGVGKAFGLPSLRTVQAVLPHTALRSTVSTSGLARYSPGSIKGEEPKVGEEGIHLIHQTVPSSSWHPVIQGRQHPLGPHRPFHPVPRPGFCFAFSRRRHCQN
jgi:hypothetical protein